jgi:hypothetical protein
MKSWLPFNSALTPLLLAGLLSGITTGCNKNKSSDSGGNINGTPYMSATIGNNVVKNQNFSTTDMVNIDDTASHMIQITGITVNEGDTTSLAVSFPDTLSSPTVVSFNGVTSNLSYSNQAEAENYYQAFANALGTLTITGINTTTHRVSGSFSGSVYKRGSVQDSTLNVYQGSFVAVYTTP